MRHTHPATHACTHTATRTCTHTATHAEAHARAAYHHHDYGANFATHLNDPTVA